MRFKVKELNNLDILKDTLYVVIENDVDDIEIPFEFTTEEDDYGDTEYIGELDISGTFIDFFLGLENENNDMYIIANSYVDLYLENINEDGYTVHITNALEDGEEEDFIERCTVIITQQRLFTTEEDKEYENIIMKILEECEGQFDLTDMIDMQDLLKYAVSYTATEREEFEQKIEEEIKRIQRQRYMQSRSGLGF